MPNTEGDKVFQDESPASCPACGKPFNVALGHSPSEEDLILVSHAPKHAAIKEVALLDPKPGTGVTGAHVQFDLPERPTQQRQHCTTRESARTSSNDYRSICRPCKASHIVLSQMQEASAQFMAIALQFYTSAPSETQKSLDAHWPALCRAAQNLSQLQSCGEAAPDDSASAISDSSSNTPADVYRYFRLYQEMFLINENIRELELDQVASMESSHHSKDVDGAACFEAKRRELTRALENVQQQLEAHKEICVARGLNPESYRHRRVSSRHSNHAAIEEWLQCSSQV